MKDLDRQRLDQIAADLLAPFAQARGPGMTIGVLQDDELSFASDRTRSLGTELEIRPFQDDDAHK